MSHIPFGYKIVDGLCVPDEEKSEQLRALFSNYLAGMSINAAAKEAGFTQNHSQIRRMLLNKNYAGNSFYPRLLEDELFQKVADEIARRQELDTRARYHRPNSINPIQKSFRFGAMTEIFKDPVSQAEYAYSKIESEDNP